MKPTVDVKLFNGLWAPYEIKYSDGTIRSGPFTSMSIFGVYAESIKFTDDNGYIPVIWADINNFGLKTTESGTFKIRGETKLLLTGGAWNMEFEITKLSNDEMWLSYIGEVPILGTPKTLYKLKREISNY
jgi:hypothetical protein